MAEGIVPLFTSAPRLRLHINGTSVAYAIGFNINIAIDVQPVQVVGQFAAMSLEPTMYNPVTGTIQIVRLITKTTKTYQANQTQPSNLVGDLKKTATVDDGTELTSPSGDIVGKSKADANSILTLNGLHRHMDPSKVLLSRTFDMDIYLKVPSAIPAAETDPEAALQLESSNWLRIKNCRLVSRNTNISQGQLVNEPVNFQGLLATPMYTDNDIDTESFTLDSGLKEKLVSDT